MFINTTTTLNTPVAGASDQCTGNSFASQSPCGDTFQKNTGGTKCVAQSSSQMSLSLLAMIHPVVGGQPAQQRKDGPGVTCLRGKMISSTFRRLLLLRSLSALAYKADESHKDNK